jgi:two-component system, NarL family, nitrate/nitrite response regulator NarL
MRIRVILVDDHPIVLQGLQQLFARHEDFEVVACCADAETALAAAHAHHPAVVVTDLRMPRMSGLDLLAALNRDLPACRTVLLTATISQEEVMDALKHGVSGLVLKDSPAEQLVACVRKVHRGEQSLDPGSVARALTDVVERDKVRGELSRTLTAREIEIVQMVARGLRNRTIGEQLSIAESTVKVHLHNIYEKLGVEGRLELVLLAQQKGLV